MATIRFGNESEFKIEEPMQVKGRQHHRDRREPRDGITNLDRYAAAR
jgi:hypothetical protein